MCFWIVGSVLDCGKWFWILGRVLESRKCFALMSHRNNRTYNPVGLNKVSHCSRRSRAPTYCSRLPVKKFKSLLKKTRKVRLFVWTRILKNTLLPSKIHCYVKNRNGLYLNRYRSNVRFLLRASPK